MADDTTQETQETAPDDEQAGDPSALGDPGKKALDAERTARREAEKRAKELADRLQEIEDAEKSELQKIQERAEAAEKAASQHERELMRLQIAHEKGLTPAQAKRLSGDDREALAADADELLELLSPPEQEPPPGGRPKTLHSGNAADGKSDSFDPEALANKIYQRNHI